MSENQRVYSDEEFALILRKATEMASLAESPASASAGLTLAEMKSAAAQVGFDPALVERAARMLVATVNATPFEQIIGGPLQHQHEVRLPIGLDETRAAFLLSAVRIRAGLAGAQDVGHFDAMGMSWHDGGTTESLRVTARPEENDTAVSVVVDRRGTFVVVAFASGLTMFFASLFAMFALFPESPAQGLGGLIAGIGGTLAVARGYWASSTTKVRERISVVMDSVGQTLTRLESQASGVKTLRDSAHPVHATEQSGQSGPLSPSTVHHIGDADESS